MLSRVDLPYPELLAAHLDGELYPVDTCFAPVDELERPIVRAAALVAGLNSRLIAEQRTAAWVWGATARPPTPHEFCATLDARVAHRTAPGMIVREVVIDPEDVHMVGTLQVTSPLRTAVDLARFCAQFGDRESQIVRALMQLGGFGVQQCIDQLNRRRNLHNKKLAAERLTRLQQERSARPPYVNS